MGYHEEWERQDHETARAFEAFCAYRDYGPARSVTKVVQGCHGTLGSESLFHKFSMKYDWVYRCEQYDRHVEHLRYQEMRQYEAEMAKRHVEQAKRLQIQALAALERIDPSQLTPSDVLRYLEVGMRLERLAVGSPNQDQPGQSAEELERIKNRENATRICKEILERTDHLLATRGASE